MELILCISKSVNEKIIPLIDELKFIGLDRTGSERIELFLFAMALGVKEGKRTPFQGKSTFVRESAIKSMDGAMSNIFSLLVDELRKSNEEEKIDNKTYAFKVAEEYANTGFIHIGEMLSGTPDIESLQYQLIEEMDDKYAEIHKID